MSTRTSNTSKPASGTGKSAKTTRAGRKRSTARAANASATSGAKATPRTAAASSSPADARTAKATPKAAPASAAAITPEPMVVSEVKPVVASTTLRKKALIEAVTERSGVKRRDAKAALESALELLGEAIAAGKQINLPGFGKLKVNRTKQLANGQVFIARIRQPVVSEGTAKGGEDDDDTDTAGKAGKAAVKDPLAEAAE